MKIEIFEAKVPNHLVQLVKNIDIDGIAAYINDPYTFTTGIVRDNEGEIIATGLIRVVNELKVILKPELSNINKAMALKLLLIEAKKRLQCNEAVALITQGGTHYTNILKTHFNFYEDPGIFLRLERDV